MPGNKKEKCDRCNKLKLDLELCGDDRLCRRCEVDNAVEFTKIQLKRNALHSTGEGDCDDDVCSDKISVVAPNSTCQAPCPVCAAQFGKLQEQLSEVWNAHNKLAKEVAEFKRSSAMDAAVSMTRSNDHVKLSSEISEIKAAVTHMMEDQGADKSWWNSNRPTTTLTVTNGSTNSRNYKSQNPLVSVHAELADVQRRKCNVVVSGLPVVEGVTDCDQFTQLCEENLSVKPSIIREQCRRLGAPTRDRDRPRLFLVVLRNEESATELLSAAKDFRKSADIYIQQNMYVNRDLTPAEAELAFKQREERRRRLLNQNSKQSGTVTASAAVTTATGTPLSSLADEFIPIGSQVTNSTNQLQNCS